MAYKIKVFPPSNQFPKAACKLYAKSIAIKHPVGEGYKEILSVV